MSQSDERASDAVPADPPADFVYDFLYHDARRVGSFLAQFDPSGHLTALKQTESAESGSGMKFSATTGANIVVARGGATFEDQRTAGEREVLERAYDPLWTNARALLDFLAERGMICRDMRRARIGQFVLASGPLTVMDLTFWKGLWSLPTVKRVLMESASELNAESQGSASPQDRSERRHAVTQHTSKTCQKSPIENQFEAAFEMIGMLPHTVQARLRDDNDCCIWCSLREEDLVVSASDLILKHRVTVSGRWNMLGILDAVPELNALLDNAGAMLGASAFGELMLHLTPAIRGILGRPQSDYGMTPLMIFREIAA